MFETITAFHKDREQKGGNVVTFDGVHPGDLGHRVMARGVLKAMGLNKEALDAIESKWNTSPRLAIGVSGAWGDA